MWGARCALRRGVSSGCGSGSFLQGGGDLSSRTRCEPECLVTHTSQLVPALLAAGREWGGVGWSEPKGTCNVAPIGKRQVTPAG